MLLFRLKVTSRKLIIFLFASMVIRSPLRLKIRQISFFMFSVSLGVVLMVASPSSLLSPTLMLRSCSCERRKRTNI